MPELPEVETVAQEINAVLKDNSVIDRIEIIRGDLRFPVPARLPKYFSGQKITQIRRRAKYILFETPKYVLLSHLGMSGSWRFIGSNEKLEKHDHCLIHFVAGKKLVFHDPRRFGLLDFFSVGSEQKHPRLKELGPEPLFQESFSGQYLYEKSRKRNVTIKAFIMDQKTVVGIGNIYASEALFRAGILPLKLAAKMTPEQCHSIVVAAQKTLVDAIKSGGSSIRDYRNTSGEKGDFQSLHNVYDRTGLPCRRCKTPIRSKVIVGRSTYWCPKCQS